MSFSKEWDDIYKANQQMSVWPFSDLVSYIMRHARPRSSDFRILELGCGAGANIPFFKSLGVKYYSVEGSAAIVYGLQQRFPELRDSIVVGDFTQDIPFSGLFDLVVDRGSLTHNTSAAIRNGMKLIHEKLRPEGKFIGIDWFSTAHSDYKKGRASEDPYTRSDYEDGQFKGVGRVHFSDKKHLEELFSFFVIERMEHKVVTREVPSDYHVYAFWNLVARKI